MKLACGSAMMTTFFRCVINLVVITTLSLILDCFILMSISFLSFFSSFTYFYALSLFFSTNECQIELLMDEFCSTFVWTTHTYTKTDGRVKTAAQPLPNIFCCHCSYVITVTITLSASMRADADAYKYTHLCSVLARTNHHVCAHSWMNVPVSPIAFLSAFTSHHHLPSPSLTGRKHKTVMDIGNVFARKSLSWRQCANNFHLSQAKASVV